MDDAPEDDLDALVRRVDPERWLSSRLIADAEARADVIALYAFDYEVARAPRVASNALIGEMRLVWWTEVLDQIFAGQPVRRHPVAEALALAVRRRDLRRDELEAVIDARYGELEEGAPSQDADAAAAVAVLVAGALDPATDIQAAAPAGRAWGLAQITRRGEPADTADLAAANAAARRLSVAAFPAVAHATLARTGARRPGAFESRWRLTWASLTGRL